MSLNPLGSNPILQVQFNTPDSSIYMSGILSIKDKIPGAGWSQIFLPFNNKDADTHSFTIDPTKVLSSGSSLQDLKGCQIGWVVSIFDLNNPLKITFTFNLDIQQSGTSILPAPVQTIETSPNVTISDRGDQGIFNEKFTF
jgi:hypothetical protein